jgi:hypothetical protein
MANMARKTCHSTTGKPFRGAAAKLSAKYCLTQFALILDTLRQQRKSGVQQKRGGGLGEALG